MVSEMADEHQDNTYTKLSESCSTIKLYCCNPEQIYTPKYEYFGYIMHEHMSCNNTVEELSSPASRSFGQIVNSFKKLKNMGIKTYETLYKLYVLSITNYAAAVWGYQEQTTMMVVQNRIQWFYLGVNSFAPVSDTHIEFNWPIMRSTHWVEMIRYPNRLKLMPNSRWPKKVLKWELSLDGWTR